MQVYKVFLKIVRENIGLSIMYLCIFLFISLFMVGSTLNSNNTNTNFEKTSLDISIINNDIDSDITKGLYDTLAKNNNIKDIGTDVEKLQEALFYRDVSYIVIIPEGFTESFKNNGNIKIGKMQVKDTNTGMYIDIEINKYFNSLELYSKYGDENTNYIDTVLSNSDIKSNAIIQDGTNKKSTINAMDFYFLFSAYILLAVIPFSVSTFIITFNKKEIKDRTHCSPLTNKKINMQILIGILSYCLIILLTLVISAACIYPTDFFTLRGFFHSLNMFVYIMVCMALSFTIGNMVKSSIALNGAINVISLSFCFLGGIFVSQEILGKTVSMVGSFTPTYWFAKASNEIALTTNYSGNSLNQILIYMGIVLGFAIAFFAIGLVTTKQKRNNK